MPDTEAAFADALTIWAEIAPKLAFEADAYAPRVARARLKERNSRIVVLLEAQGRPSLILKRNLDGTHINHFRNGVTAHRAAELVFEGQTLLHVPKLLHVDEDRQVLVMAFAPGYTAHDALDHAILPQDRSRVLADCGAWIGHWHGATYLRDNKIAPDTMQSFLAAQCDKVKAGTLVVPGKAAFIRCAEFALARAEAARGKVTRLASTHGDMNLRNLMIGPDGVWGLDFGAVHTAPIGHDLARFIVNFANFHFPDDGPDDPAWLNRDLESFFAGYGMTAREDPGFDYLLRMQLLKDWTTIPVEPDKRNLLHKRRWKGLQILRKLLFVEAP